MSETWLDFAIKRPGPPDKVGYGAIKTSDKEGLVAHSMEGPLSAALGELDRPDRQASWHFSIARGGEVYQHYPVEAVVWASGSYEANRRFVAVEHEGWAGELLTDAQVESLARVIVACGRRFGWGRYERQVTLWEHREMTRFGSAPTACPSGRVPWDRVLARVQSLLMTGEVRGMLSLSDKPVGVTGQPIRAYFLRGWQWQEDEVMSYQQLLVGLAEGWLRPKWLHELLEALGNAEGVKLPVPGQPPGEWPTLNKVVWDCVRHTLDQSVHVQR